MDNTSKINRITKIEVQKRNKKRVNLYINDEYAMAFSTELAFKHNLKIGQEVDYEELKIIAEEDNYIKCKGDALRFIEKSYKTERQVYDKLLSKGYDNKTIERVIDFLTEYKFIDDWRFGELYIEERLKREGRNKIKYSLMQKGISESIIDEKLNCVDRDKEKDALNKIAEKKYKSILKNEEDKAKIYNKLGRFLMSKGYFWEDVKSVLNKLLYSDG
ncbi:recombination regulator RecX [Clostridium tetani]|uniref:recombination regulator RecX n=1 Tax=Clostridium tetani TaxID=1513 RepID=UPI00100B7ECE|nr:recombination regulator RecX [Clostridium tetani]RXI39322.1 recombination regulator RecX [Clostridium tetani]